MLETGILSSVNREATSFRMMRIRYLTLSTFLTARKLELCWKLRCSNQENSGGPYKPGLDFYFPLFLIFYFIISSLQVCFLEASLNAFHNKMG